MIFGGADWNLCGSFLSRIFAPVGKINLSPCQVWFGSCRTVCGAHGHAPQRECLSDLDILPRANFTVNSIAGENFSLLGRSKVFLQFFRFGKSLSAEGGGLCWLDTRRAQALEWTPRGRERLASAFPGVLTPTPHHSLRPARPSDSWPLSRFLARF